MSHHPKDGPELYRIGIAPPGEYMRKLREQVRGKVKPGPDDPRVWVPSLDYLRSMMRNKERLEALRAHVGGAAGDRLALETDSKGNHFLAVYRSGARKLT